VLLKHPPKVAVAGHQVLQELLVGERPGVDLLEGEVGANRGGFCLLVPVAQVLAPELGRKGSLSVLEALGELLLRRGSHAYVGDPVHEPMLWIEDGGPVAAQALDEAAREGIMEGRRLGHEAGHRARVMAEVGLPRSRAGRLELKILDPDLGASSDAHLLPPWAWRAAPPPSGRYPATPGILASIRFSSRYKTWISKQDSRSITR
jgi:hypothetical protein